MKLWRIYTVKNILFYCIIILFLNINCINITSQSDTEIKTITGDFVLSDAKHVNVGLELGWEENIGGYRWQINIPVTYEVICVQIIRLGGIDWEPYYHYSVAEGYCKIYLLDNNQYSNLFGGKYKITIAK